MLRFEENIDIEKCVYCGKCMYDCPLYEKKMDQVFSVRGKIIVMREGIHDDRLLVCSYCGNCIDQCPLKIDISGYLLLKYWPKSFFRAKTVPIAERGMLSLKSSELLWTEVSGLEEALEGLGFDPSIKIIETNEPFLYLFLYKYRQYFSKEYEINFVKDQSGPLPSYMERYFSKEGDFEQKYYYEQETDE